MWHSSAENINIDITLNASFTLSLISHIVAGCCTTDSTDLSSCELEAHLSILSCIISRPILKCI